LPFKPSNISLDGIDASKLGDFVVDRQNCVIQSEKLETSCGDMSVLQYKVVEQPGAGRIGVYFARNFKVDLNTILRVEGTAAIAIVTLDKFEVLGQIDASARGDNRSAGGFTHQGRTEAKGGGLGGGGAGSATNGAGGGSFCGLGGKGAALPAGTEAEGGIAYGNPELIPLVGGSAGGSAALSASGSGGGAMQLVAGKTFLLGSAGALHVGGGGGTFVGAAGSQHGAGGGSGGAILIEAPVTTLMGTLAANGGAGGSRDYGKDATPDAVAATSRAQTDGSVGGTGSAAEEPNGGNGVHVGADQAPGGGGGAGRIRINNEQGMNPLTATYSPSANLPCVTGGKLAK
jgi:hypothetical protein